MSAATYTAAGIVRTKYAKHIISPFLLERMDLEVNDWMFQKTMCPPIELVCAAI